MKRAALLLFFAAVALAAVPQRAQLTISWDDNSRDETAFELERSPDGVRFHLIALLRPNTTTYVDRMLHAGVTYTYRVRAVRDRDTSGFSNTATAQVSREMISNRQRSSE